MVLRSFPSSGLSVCPPGGAVEVFYFDLSFTHNTDSSEELLKILLQFELITKYMYSTVQKYGVA